jgi:putative membrane protein
MTIPTMKLKTVIQGFIMGIGEIVPVAGASTLALVMGIYDEFVNLLYSISNFFKSLAKFIFLRIKFKDLKQSFKEIHFGFGLPLATGAILSVILLTRAMHSLLETNQTEVYAFVFGLVLASIYVPWKEIRKASLKEYSVILFTATIFFFFFGISNITFVESPSQLYFLFSGIVAVSAVVLPGISASFILVLLGMYNPILELVSKLLDFNITASELLSLGLFGFGAVLGFTILIRFLKYSLMTFSNIVFSILVGIMLASLRVLWPFDPNNGANYLPIFLLIAIGALVPFVITWVSNLSNRDSIKEI